ncbi:RloB family protein [Saccharothrix longispora]|uniref:RloB family protein n=1 Tax=Saccharothrix longispora TaxID=33920 RepID=UPI0028FD4D3E|nr:RloB family protein [Saccharothrix longispora]MDU0291384.1 RloB family protein [Saccharothrix longispora]
MGTRRELRTVVIFTEGRNSEPDYLNGLRRLPHVAGDVALNVELRPEHSVPLPLVEQAVKRAQDPEVDECWCVFDVEWPQNHPNLAEAVALARRHDIRLAVSNPCFELWLILHHRDHSAFVDTVGADRLSRQLDRRPGKSIDAAVYMPLRSAAARRARLLEERHGRDGTVFPNDNPASGMHALLASLDTTDTA